jgi:hypothetical protein
MHLDRSKQLAMLNALAAVYPRYTTAVVDAEVTEEDLANLWYLKEQGLVDGALEMSLSQSYIFQGARITAKGLDFLADDGGISAILGTVTVRLHADSIKELLLTRIDSSSAPPEKKSWLKKQIETASSETIKKIVGSLLDQGVKRAPELLQWVEQAIQSAKSAA